MGKYTKIAITVPDVNRSFAQGSYKYSAPQTIKANKQVLNEVYSNFGNFIDKWGVYLIESACSEENARKLSIFFGSMAIKKQAARYSEGFKNFFSRSTTKS